MRPILLSLLRPRGFLLRTQFLVSVLPYVQNTRHPLQTHRIPSASQRVNVEKLEFAGARERRPSQMAPSAPGVRFNMAVSIQGERDEEGNEITLRISDFGDSHLMKNGRDYASYILTAAFGRSLAPSTAGGFVPQPAKPVDLVLIRPSTFRASSEMPRDG